MPDINVNIIDLDPSSSIGSETNFAGVSLDGSGHRFDLEQIANFVVSDHILTLSNETINGDSYVLAVDSSGGAPFNIDFSQIGEYIFENSIPSFPQRDSTTISSTADLVLVEGSTPVKVELSEIVEYGFESYVPNLPRLTSSTLASDDSLSIFNESNGRPNRTELGDISNYVFNQVPTLGNINPDNNTRFLVGQGTTGATVDIDDVARYVHSDYLYTLQRLFPSAYANNDKIPLLNHSSQSPQYTELSDLALYVFRRIDSLVNDPLLGETTRFVTNTSGIARNTTLGDMGTHILSNSILSREESATVDGDYVIPFVDGTDPGYASVDAFSNFVWDSGDTLPTAASLTNTDYIALNKNSSGQKTTLLDLANYVKETRWSGDGFESSLTGSDQIQVRDVSQNQYGYTNCSTLSEFVFGQVPTLPLLSSIDGDDVIPMVHSGIAARLPYSTLESAIVRNASPTVIQSLDSDVVGDITNGQSNRIGTPVDLDPNSTYIFEGSIWVQNAGTLGLHFGITTSPGGNGESYSMQVSYGPTGAFQRSTERVSNFFVSPGGVSNSTNGFHFKGILKTPNIATTGQMGFGKLTNNLGTLIYQRDSWWSITKSA